MAKDQKEDKDVKVFPTAITGLRIMPFQINNSSLMCDVSTGQPRPLVPQTFQRHVFEAIHNLAHPEAIPLNNTSTTDCARALIRHWISRFGVPLDITSDGGSQLTSTLWNKISQQLGVQIHRTTAYHPQSNSLIERFHRTLKAALKARLTGPNWADELPWVLLGLRTAPKRILEHLLRSSFTEHL
ncbi:Pol polyprotein [Elysia marginata]|uniref:Pol polyprotein n=1 Tax=Elysia marginata TaxID=1093978 RepID=A0AAV4H822_9GAST|nr:Pol polyprotein [Elysia marginata]